MSFASFVLLPGYLASKISRQRWNIFVLFYLYAQTKNCYSFPSVFQPSPIHPERLQQWRPSYPPPGDQASVATGRTSFAACAMASSSSALITECSMPSMLLPSMKPPLIAATSRTSFAASNWPLHRPFPTLIVHTECEQTRYVVAVAGNVYLYRLVDASASAEPPESFSATEASGLLTLHGASSHAPTHSSAKTSSAA